MGPIILAAQLQNPFGFDRLDLDVALLGMRLHKELCSISHACAFSDIQSFTKLTFLGLHKRLELDAKRNTDTKKNDMTTADRIKAKKAFNDACIRFHDQIKAEERPKDVVMELDRAAFSQLVVKLITEANSEGAAFDVPSEDSLQKIFDVADADGSGTVDQGEFLELYKTSLSNSISRGGFFSGHRREEMIHRQHLSSDIDGKEIDGERQVYLAGVPLFRLPKWLSKKLTDKSKNKAVAEVNDEISHLAEGNEEMRRWAKRLFKSTAAKDQGGEKVLNLVQFKDIVKKMVSETNIPSDKTMEAAFTAADTDKSGGIDCDEFMALFASLIEAEGSAMKIYDTVPRDRKSFVSLLGLSRNELKGAVYDETKEGAPPPSDDHITNSGEQTIQGSVGNEATSEPDYHNSTTGETCWDHPDDHHKTKASLNGWGVHQDEASGQIYYHNVLSGETRWDHPDFKVHETPEDDDNDREDMDIYAQHSSSEMNFDMMNPLRNPKLAPEWDRHVDPSSGKEYYSNVTTGETSWEFPPALQSSSNGNDGELSNVSNPLAVDPEGRNNIVNENFEDWESHVDEDSQRTFYYNKKTGETRWDKPNNEQKNT